MLVGSWNAALLPELYICEKPKHLKIENKPFKSKTRYLQPLKLSLHYNVYWSLPMQSEKYSDILYNIPRQTRRIGSKNIWEYILTSYLNKLLNYWLNTHMLTNLLSRVVSFAQKQSEFQCHRQDFSPNAGKAAGKILHILFW